MSRIFVSHASSDGGEVVELAEMLRTRGFGDLFLDTDGESGLVVGMEWEGRLYAELARASVLILVDSAASHRSYWCQREVGIARSRGAHIVVLPIEDGLRPLGLNAVQQLTYRADRVERHRSCVDAVAKLVNPTGAASLDDVGNPYPGLVPYSSHQAHLFFGRSDEIDELARAVQPTFHSSGGVLVVTGRSGVGKSSLVRAGLLPVLRSTGAWLVPDPIVPTGDLSSDLDDVRSELGVAAGRDTVSGDLQTMVHHVRHATTRTVLIVVDQAERLFTRPELLASDANRAALGELRAAMRSSASRLWLLLVTTTEGESVERIRDWIASGDGEMGVQPPLGEYRIAPITGNRARASIEGPARRRGVSLEEPLVQVLLGLSATDGGLPLMAFTLRALWNHTSPHRRLLLVDYEHAAEAGALNLDKVGGGALREAVAITTARAVERFLLRLVDVVVDAKEEVRPLARSLPMSTLSSAERDMTAPFVAARLMSMSTPQGAGSGRTEAMVSLAHDDVIKRWRYLADLVGDHTRELTLRHTVKRLRVESEKQHTTQTGASVALTGWMLDAALAVDWDDPADAGFIATSATRRSRSEEQQRRARWTAPLAVVLVGSVLLAGWIWRQQRLVASQRDEIRALGLVAQARVDSESRPEVALAEALAAVGIRRSNATWGGLVDTVNQHAESRVIVQGTNGEIRSAAVDDVGTILLARTDGLSGCRECLGCAWRVVMGW